MFVDNTSQTGTIVIMEIEYKQNHILKPPRFLADAMLGKLSRYLRISGFDTYYWHAGDGDQVKYALQSDRCLLSRNQRILKECLKIKVLTVFSPDYNDSLIQFKSVYQYFRLDRWPSLPGRCPRCNGILCRVRQSNGQGRVPDYINSKEKQIFRCQECGHFYWEGSHLKNHFERISDLTESSYLRSQDQTP